MRMFRSMDEVKAARLPPWQHEAVQEAVGTLEGIFGTGYDPAKGGIVLIEQGDTPEDGAVLLGYPMADKLETTWRRHGCLICVTLWGNSGAGLTWVCPERPGYAPQVQELLRREL